MPIIQMPGNVDPRSIGSTLNAGINQFAGEKRQNDARMRELRERLKFQQAENEIRYAHAAQEEYARRQREEREYGLQLMREQGRDRRFWQSEASDAGLSPEISGQNIIQMGARLEELDPARYGEFLGWLRSTTGIDFGDGPQQVIPTPEMLEQLPHAPAIFSRLTQALIPLEDANDEREIQAQYVGALETIRSHDPQWLESMEGQELMLEYEASLLSPNVTPMEATRRRKMIEGEAMKRIGLKRDRSRYAQKIEDLIQEHGLGANQYGEDEGKLERIRELQSRIWNSRTPKESYLRALAIADPTVNQVAAMAHADGVSQGQAASAAQQVRLATPRIDPQTHPKLYEALRATPPTEFEKHLDRNGIDPADVTSEDHDAIATFKRRGDRTAALREEELQERFPDRVPDDEEFLEGARRNGVDVNDPAALEAFRPRFEEFKRRQRLRQIEQMDRERGFRRQ